MHGRMSTLLSANPCEEDQQVCDQAYDWTENATVAEIADIVIGKPLAIAGLLILGIAVRWLLHRVIDRMIRRAETGVLPDRVNIATSTRRVQRAQTMGSLLKSVVTGVLVAVFGTMILSEVGVNIAPIIASAGIIGIALGFGAQSLVKDFLSGTFMIFEDQYGVGDVVDIGEAIGTVEAVTLRITRLRDLNGTVWYVPNGEILRVGNMSQNWARAVIDVSVAYSEDLARVKRILLEVAKDLYEDDEFNELIIEEPEVTGVEMLAADSVNLRVMLKTLPLEQWAVGRELRQRIKARFDHEGIEIPFAQRVVWHREERAAADPDTESGADPAAEASSGE
jgi:moderate conductance mechanosensitive channel